MENPSVAIWIIKINYINKILVLKIAQKYLKNIIKLNNKVSILKYYGFIFVIKINLKNKNKTT